MSDTGMGTYYPRVRRDRGVCPRGNPRRAMAPEAPAIRQSASGTGVSTPFKAVSTRQVLLCGFGLLELLGYGMTSDLWMRTNPLQVRRDRGLGPRRNPRHAVAPKASANQQSASGTGVSTPCGTVSSWEICLYVPVLLELYRYGWVSYTGMGTYYPRVRRDRGVCPCGNPRRAMAPEAPANW